MGMGITVTNEVERKGKMLAVWEAMRCLLGDDYRDDDGQLIPSDQKALRWTWIRIGHEIKKWMTDRAKSTAVDRVLNDDASGRDVEELEGIGIYLWETKRDRKREGTEAGAQSADPEKRAWNEEGQRMRTAKEMKNDPEATEEQRAAAVEWCEQNRGKRKAAKPSRRGERRVQVREREERERECLGGGQGADD